MATAINLGDVSYVEFRESEPQTVLRFGLSSGSFKLVASGSEAVGELIEFYNHVTNKSYEKQFWPVPSEIEFSVA